jgi:NADPH:quinone reductase-like Zn-dependent oxidoreductase
MRAAVVRSFDQRPRYEEFDLPAPSSPDEEVVDVLAVGLHPRTKSGADGSHYTSTDALPMIPGIDGVGRTNSGKLVYFILPDTAIGSLAEQTVVDRRRSIELPDDADPVALAAAMNPAMSSWVALHERIDFRPGSRVLVLGATGNAGQMAVQIAKHLGAAEVVGAGRDAERLAALTMHGADTVVSLAGDADEAMRALGSAAADVDVVIDYLWGSVTEDALVALVMARKDAGKRLDWIEIGSMAGQDIRLPSAALRAANLHLIGSGQGSVPTRNILRQLDALAAEIAKGTFTIGTKVVALADVETVWNETAPAGKRFVFVPQI